MFFAGVIRILRITIIVMSSRNSRAILRFVFGIRIRIRITSCV